MGTQDSRDAMDSTLALVTRAREGDRRALEMIAARCLDDLTRYAHGRLPADSRGLADTCDLVQVAITRTLQHLDAFDPRYPGALLAYMRKAVLNLVRDEVRRARRRPAGDPIDDDLPDAAPDPLQQAITRERIERYETALSEMPLEQQRAIVLCLEFDYSWAQIARDLGRPSPEAARSFVSRAIRDLARRVARVASP